MRSFRMPLVSLAMLTLAACARPLPADKSNYAFVVGVGFMSTEFVVTAPPHEDGGVWKMTADGVELTRASDASDVVEAPGSTST